MNLGVRLLEQASDSPEKALEADCLQLSGAGGDATGHRLPGPESQGDAVHTAYLGTRLRKGCLRWELPGGRGEWGWRADLWEA